MIDEGGSGVEVRAGEDLGARAGLGEGQAHRTIGNDSTISMGDTCGWIEGEVGDGAVVGDDYRQISRSPAETAEGRAGDAAEGDRARTGGDEGAVSEGESIGQGQIPSVDGGAAGDGVTAGEGERAGTRFGDCSGSGDGVGEGLGGAAVEEERRIIDDIATGGDGTLDFERAGADGGGAGVGIGFIKHERTGADLGQADFTAEGTGGIGKRIALGEGATGVGGVDNQPCSGLQTLGRGIRYRDVAEQGVQIGDGKAVGSGGMHVQLEGDAAFHVELGGRIACECGFVGDGQRA